MLRVGQWHRGFVTARATSLAHWTSIGGSSAAQRERNVGDGSDRQQHGAAAAAGGGSSRVAQRRQEARGSLAHVRAALLILAKGVWLLIRLVIEQPLHSANRAEAPWYRQQCGAWQLLPCGGWLGLGGWHRPWQSAAAATITWEQASLAVTMLENGKNRASATHCPSSCPVQEMQQRRHGRHGYAGGMP